MGKKAKAHRAKVQKRNSNIKKNIGECTKCREKINHGIN